MTADEKLKIIDNILARSGGIENIDLYGELAKATSMMNTFAAQQQLSDMQNMASMTPPQTQGSIISPESGQSTPLMPTEPTMPQNEGQGAMNLPM
jgi:hypothetical protein